MSDPGEIYNLSGHCEQGFKSILEISKPSSLPVIEVLYGRFMQWASYLGAFAPASLSLDSRLAHSHPLRALVVQLLEMTKENLSHVEILEREHREIEPSSSPQSLINEMREKDTIQSPLVETLQVLEAAVDGLHRLGVAIRQSPSTDLDQRITSFIERRAEWNMQPVFLVRLKSQLIDRAKNQNNQGAPLSLCKQLASSISFRYFRMLYIRSHQAKLETRREAAPVPSATIRPSYQPVRSSAPLHNQSSAPKPGDIPTGLNSKLRSTNRVVDDVSESAPTMPHSKAALELYKVPQNQRFASDIVSQVSVRLKNAKYPDPPELNPLHSQVACPYCTKLLDRNLLENKRKWERHVSDDLKLYACISEDCLDPPRLFARLDEWKSHMTEEHSRQWPQQIHQPTWWSCDTDHREMLFHDGDQFDLHIRNVHPEHGTKSDIDQFREWCEIKLPRPPYTCPICGCIPEKIAVVAPWLVQDPSHKSINVSTSKSPTNTEIDFDLLQRELTNHIGSHLKELGLMSIEYLDEDEDGSNVSKQHEVSSGAERDKLMGVHPVDALDTDFRDYLSPPPPSPLDDDIILDWSRVKDFSIPTRVSLWSRAYDALHESEPSFVNSYEKRLSKGLQDETTAGNTVSQNPLSQNSDLDHTDNRISRDPNVRWAQFEAIADRALRQADDSRTEFTAFGHSLRVKKQDTQAAQLIQEMRASIKTSFEASPALYLVWAGVCVILPVLVNPDVAVQFTNIDGLLYIISRIYYYIELERMCLSESNVEVGLENHVLELYQCILQFLINTVLQPHRLHFATRKERIVDPNPTETILMITQCKQIERQGLEILAIPQRGNLDNFREAAQQQYENLQSLLPFIEHDKDWETQSAKLDQCINAYYSTGAISDLQDAIQAAEALNVPEQDHLQARRLEILDTLYALTHEKHSKTRSMTDLDVAIRFAERAIQETPDTDPSKADRIGRLGQVLILKSDHTARSSDLDEAISVLHQGMEVVSENNRSCRAALLSDLGSSLSNRHELTGNMDDLDDATRFAREALDLTDEHDPQLSGRLTNLGNRIYSRYIHNGSLEDLEEVIVLAREAVSVQSPTDLHGFSDRLKNYTIRLGERYARKGDQEDIEKALAICHSSIQVSGEGSTEWADRQHTLGSLLQHRYSHTRDRTYLDEAIVAEAKAVEAAPEDNLTKARYLNTLGSRHGERYSLTKAKSDLGNAMNFTNKALEVVPQNTEDRARILNNLATHWGYRYSETQSIADLDEAIDFAKRAVEATPAHRMGQKDGSDIVKTAHRLVDKKYSRTQSTSDLEDAILVTRGAVNVIPAHDVDHALLLEKLGSYHDDRYYTTKTAEDLEAAIHFMERSLESTPPGHSSWASRCNNVGLRLGSRYSLAGNVEDLKRAIDASRKALEATPDGNPNRPDYLNNLGLNLGYEYARTGSREVLSEAIQLARSAVKHASKDHPNWLYFLTNLGNRMGDQFEQTGDVSNLEEATKLAREVFEATDAHGPQVAVRMNNLGERLRQTYLLTGNGDYLNQAIGLSRQIFASNSFPMDHPERPEHLINLALQLGDRYLLTGSGSDLEEAIHLAEEAVQLTNKSHPDRASRLNALGSLMGTKYSRTSHLPDLDEAIVYGREAANAEAAGHLGKRAEYLNNLSNRLSDRYAHTRALEDLNEAVNAADEAVDAITLGHPDRAMYTNNLALHLDGEYTRTEKAEDLDQDLLVARGALELLPSADHPERAPILNTIGILLMTRFGDERHRSGGSMEDLDEALRCVEEAVRVTPKGRPDRVKYLNNVGHYAGVRYQRLHRTEDLNKAIAASKKAMEGSPENHPDRTAPMSNLGRLLTERGETGDLEEAKRLLESVLHFDQAPIRVHINAATKKHALLLGCPDVHLKGVRQDLQTMRNILASRGFACETVYKATRDQIVTGLQTLARDAAPGDAVVVYYSGHGALVRRSSSGASGRPLQFLVPCDFDETTDQDFRGVTDAQLSQLLRGITDRTDNVTLVLDCCHAARMARVPGTVKTVDEEFYKEVFGHIRNMLEDGRLDADSAHSERNPRLVTVAASAPGESAYERPFEGESQLGVLTEALERILGRAPDGREALMQEVSWRSVMVRVRDRFEVTCPSQFPQIEGDDLRFTFSLSRAELDGALPVEITDGGQVVLHGGEPHGIRKGDTYAVLPATEEHNMSSREIATATVERVGPVASRVFLDKDVAQIERQHGKSGGMKAFPKSRKMGKLPVAVRHSRSAVDISGLIAASPFLYVTDERESAPFASVWQEKTTLYLESREAGDVVLTGRWDLTRKTQTKSMEDCVRKMEAMARSRHLFAVAKQTESKDIARCVSVEVGTVVDGEKQPSGPRGLVVEEGDRIYIEVRNEGRSTVYVSIFDLCPDSVLMLSAASPSGYELMPWETYLYGKRNYFGDLVGSRMIRSNGMPRDSTRFFERIVVVVTSERVDLRCLETRSGLAPWGEELDEEGLSDLLSDIIFDTRRGVAAAQRNEPVQFGMRWASMEILGHEYPSALTNMANLALTYRNQGRWKEAEELEV